MSKWEFGCCTASYGRAAGSTILTHAYGATALQSGSKYSSVDANRGFAYGSGDRRTYFQTISINNWAGALHIGVTDNGGAWDNTPPQDSTALSLWYVQYANTTTYNGYDGTTGDALVGPMTAAKQGSTPTTPDAYMPSWCYTSPASYEGILFHFSNETAVNVSPVTLKFGSGASVNELSKSCQVKCLELATSNITTGWETLFFSSTKALSVHELKTHTGHNWWVALTLKSTAVGFHSSGRLEISGTYY